MLRPCAGPELTVPREYVEKGRVQQPQRSDKPSWAHPVVCGGRVYLRDMDRLLIYDVTAP
jgi:hypothetical protein